LMVTGPFVSCFVEDPSEDPWAKTRENAVAKTSNSIHAFFILFAPFIVMLHFKAVFLDSQWRIFDNLRKRFQMREKREVKFSYGGKDMISIFQSFCFRAILVPVC